MKKSNDLIQELRDFSAKAELKKSKIEEKAMKLFFEENPHIFDIKLKSEDRYDDNNNYTVVGIKYINGMFFNELLIGELDLTYQEEHEVKEIMDGLRSVGLTVEDVDNCLNLLHSIHQDRAYLIEDASNRVKRNKKKLREKLEKLT